ncbi:MAG TPA: PTS sugar transporter subunit IIA [Desulfomonilia bacterium]|nr:PTS sugar transporter subunit IIA [Desulfomonilia bacterium]
MLNSILDALEEGRLIELPDNDKKDALEVLASLLEAIPSIPAGTDVVGIVLSHERTSNTSLGLGWACPHARIELEGDLTCAIGWSPTGIDYGKPGDPLIHLIVMFLVPDSQRNRYLKEVSVLVRMILARKNLDLSKIEDLSAVRLLLLDMAQSATEGAEPAARARMIQLRAKTGTVLPAGVTLEGLEIEPLTVIASPGIKGIVLTQNQELADLTKNDESLPNAIAERNWHELRGWHIACRGSTHYVGDRVMYDCLAIRRAKT